MMLCIAETTDRFDVIVVDSTDPIGPGKVLFTSEFYRDCKRCLNPGGILVTQHGVPLLQADELTDGYRKLSALFDDVTFYLTVVPTYTGGAMTLGWATDEPRHRKVPLGKLEERFAGLGIETHYYSPAVHQGAFALPPDVQRLLTK